jgi:hypothetical protein
MFKDEHERPSDAWFERIDEGKTQRAAEINAAAVPIAMQFMLDFIARQGMHPMYIDVFSIAAHQYIHNDLYTLPDDSSCCVDDLVNKRVGMLIEALEDLPFLVLRLVEDEDTYFDKGLLDVLSVTATIQGLSHDHRFKETPPEVFMPVGSFADIRSVLRQVDVQEQDDNVDGYHYTHYDRNDIKRIIANAQTCIADPGLAEQLEFYTEWIRRHGSEPPPVYMP